MILKGIRLRNFRQFRGIHELQFATDTNRSVTMIEGPNGAGKTSLFLALNWCLYGRGLEDKGEILSKGLTDAERDEGGFVEVSFRHKGFQYVARREITARGTHEIEGDLILQEMGADNRAKRVSDPSQKMNVILAEGVRQYFFFDGEHINDLTKVGHEGQVREAVRSVLGLKVIERAVEHLGQVEHDYANDVKQTASLDSETQALVVQIESVKEQIDLLRTTRDSKAEEIAKAEAQLQDLSDKLQSLDEIREVMMEQKANRQQLGRAESNYTKLTDRLGELIGRAGPAMTGQAITHARRILDEKRDRGEIPPNIREQLIDDLLEAGVCICERHLNEAAREALLTRKRSTVSSALENQILLAAGNMNAIGGLARDVPKQLGETLKEIGSLGQEMDDLHRRNEELSGRLKDEYNEDIGTLERARRDWESRLSDLRFDQGRLVTKVEAFETQQKALSDKLQAAEAASGSAWRGKRRYELASNLAIRAEALLQRFATDMRQRIEDEADRVFKSLIWKQEHFERVKILDDYRLDVIDRYGGSALRELSAGERQVLSLAFIVAMAKVTGEEAPLVIDTPFGRISEDTLHNIAKTLPELAGQLVLLVTDLELDDQAEKLLAPFVGLEYELDFDDSTGITAIREVAHA